MIPFTVIGGFLGAGKTTLLNHLLRHSAGARIAVLVNDFGAVNIDRALIEWSDDDTIALTNGCVCCGIGNGLVEVLPPLLERVPPFDHIVVEASGVADPYQVGQYGTLPGLRLDGVVVLADAEGIRSLVADSRIGAQVLGQLRRADLIVLTKCDLVDPSAVAEVRRWLSEVVGPVPVIESVEGVVPVDVVLGQLGSERTSSQVPVDHEFAYESRSYRVPGPVDRATVLAFLEGLPGDVLRAKGFVELATSPGVRTVLHHVGRRNRLYADGPWQGDSEGVVVLIGLPGSLAVVEAMAAELGWSRLS